MNPVQTKSIGNFRYPAGTCYAIIPEAVDRESYITNCYRTGRISAQFEDGSFMTSVPVGMSVLQGIDFPDDVKQLGSQLVYVTEPTHNLPIIIDRILKDDESFDFDENQFKLQKYTDTGSVSISGMATDGNLLINAEGGNSDGGNIFIDITNPENLGLLNMNIKGDIQAEVENMTFTILSELTYNVTGAITMNSEVDITLYTIENIDIISDGDGVINLGTGDEPILLGDTTVTELDALQARVDLIINAISNGVPVPNDGGVAYQSTMVAILAADVAADFSGTKSEKSFTE